LPTAALGIEGTGRCEKIDLETWSNFGLEKTAPGCVISDHWDFGIHFGSHEISAKSIFSHLPDEVTPIEKALQLWCFVGQTEPSL
jgi:hypothetical protein